MSWHAANLSGCSGLHSASFEKHVVWHCAPEMLPLDEVDAPEIPDDDVEPELDVEPEDDVDEPELDDDPPGPVPFVVEVQAEKTARMKTSATVDFIPERLPC